MTPTFVLVHGGSHGAWCWDLLRPELEAGGYGVVAVDLPAEDPDAGATECAQVVLDAMKGVRDSVIVVGHSLAGLVLPVVASSRPVERMVFLGALVPKPGLAWTELPFDNQDALSAGPTASQLVAGIRPPHEWERARRVYYHDVPCRLARRAWIRLRRQSLRPLVERCPIGEWPNVPSTSIVMEDDRALDPTWSRCIARERLGIEPIAMPGGHSPFLARPQALASVLGLVAFDQSTSGAGLATAAPHV